MKTTTPVNRRNLLAGAAALAVAPAPLAAAPAVAEPLDPMAVARELQEGFRRRDAARAAFLATDAPLVEAEAEITRVLAEIDELYPNGDADHPGWAALFEQYRQLEGFIAETRPRTIRGAIVKLRRLLDDELGPIDNEGTADTMAQVLEFLEGFAVELDAEMPARSRPIAIADAGDRDVAGAHR